MKTEQEITGDYATFLEAGEDLKNADMIKLRELSVEDLEGRLAMTNKVRDSLSQLAKSISRHIEIKRAEQKIQEMPEAERAALLQTLQAQGVSSGEEFGKV